MTNQPNLKSFNFNAEQIESIAESIDMQIEMELDAFISDDNFEQLEILLDILTRIGYAESANQYRRMMIRQMREFIGSIQHARCPHDLKGA